MPKKLPESLTVRPRLGNGFMRKSREKLRNQNGKCGGSHQRQRKSVNKLSLISIHFAQHNIFFCDLALGLRTSSSINTEGDMGSHIQNPFHLRFPLSL